MQLWCQISMCMCLCLSVRLRIGSSVRWLCAVGWAVERLLWNPSPVWPQSACFCISWWVGHWFVCSEDWNVHEIHPFHTVASTELVRLSKERKDGQHLSAHAQDHARKTSIWGPQWMLWDWIQSYSSNAQKASFREKPALKAESDFSTTLESSWKVVDFSGFQVCALKKLGICDRKLLLACQVKMKRLLSHSNPTGGDTGWIVGQMCLLRCKDKGS